MSANIFTKKISVWSNTARTARNNTTHTVAEFLQMGELYKDTILHLRQVYTKAMLTYDTDPVAGEQLFKQYQHEKERLPLASIGGVFGNGGKMIDLITPSNLLVVDLDTCKPYQIPDLLKKGLDIPNKNVDDWQQLKRDVATLPFVGYCSLSVSGCGIFAIVPIADYKNHVEHWLSLEKLFAKFGLTIDDKTKDVPRPRFVSYDPTAIYNPQCEIYTPCLQIPTPKIITPPRAKYRGYTASTTTEQQVISCVEQIERQRMDLTADYGVWCSIAASLYDGLGDAGEDYFLRVSAFYPNANETEIRRKFRQCKNMSRITIATFFEVCSRYGIKYKDAPFTATATTAPSNQNHTFILPKEYAPKLTDGERQNFSTFYNFELIE